MEIRGPKLDIGHSENVLSVGGSPMGNRNKSGWRLWTKEQAQLTT